MCSGISLCVLLKQVESVCDWLTRSMQQAVLLLEILEAPLLALGRDGRRYRMMDPEMPEEFTQWEDHQPLSEHVLNIISDTAAGGLIVPLDEAKKKNVVDVLWRHIDHVSSTVSYPRYKHAHLLCRPPKRTTV